MLKRGMLEYGSHIDVTSYKNNTRSTLNGTGIAKHDKVWTQQHKSEQCSIRLLRPQEHVDPLWHLLSALEHEWGSFSGCNTYVQMHDWIEACAALWKT